MEPSNPNKSTSWFLILSLFALSQCEYNGLATLPKIPKNKLLSELDYYIWSADSNRFVLNEKTQFIYVNGLITEKYSYCRTTFPGHTEPTFIQCTSESFEYDALNRISSIDDVIGINSLQENRYKYNDDNLLTQITRYNFVWSTQKFTLYDSAIIIAKGGSKNIYDYFPLGYSSNATYGFDANHNVTSITYNELGTGNLLGEYSFEFDNHPNPLYRANFLSSLYFDPSYFDNPNNIVRSCIRTPQQPSQSCGTKKIYEYDIDGYPVSATIAQGDKVVYKYYR